MERIEPLNQGKEKNKEIKSEMEISINNNFDNFQNISFGKNMQKYFYLDPTYVNINHGSYGSPPKYVGKAYHKYQEEMDWNTEKWIRKEIYSKIAEIKQLIGKYINADPEELALVENASDGANAVMKSILYKKEQKALFFEFAYPMIQNTLLFLQERFGVGFEKIKINPESLNSDEMILAEIEKVIIEKGPFTLASIDHIPSTPVVIMPVKRIIQLLKKYNILSLIDGAHTVGQLHLNIKDLDPDFYISNFHKWGFSAKSATFLFCKKANQELLHPNIISNYFKQGFSTEFNYTGTRDYSAYFSIKDSLYFREKLGDDSIMEYNHDLAIKAGEEVSKLWNTEVLITDNSRIGSIINVRIPSTNEQALLKAVDICLEKFNTYVVVFKYYNKFYTRLSAQIYNDITDYIYAASNFISIVNYLEKENQDIEKIDN